MPKGFISYSHQDGEFVSQLQSRLLAAGLETWRDVHNLHAGDRWPRKLGDAIDACPIFVLIWSADARNSDFVELEWTIAIALKRTVSIIALDATLLPPTLRPYQAECATDALAASKWLLNVAPDAPSAQRAAGPVLQKLSAAPQASGPKQISANLQTGRSKMKYFVIGATFAAVAIGAALFSSQSSPGPTARPPVCFPGSGLSVPQSFSGSVQDDEGRPLRGVIVTAPALNLQQKSNSKGHFSFDLPCDNRAVFHLIAQQHGYETYTADPVAGDQNFKITLHQVSGK